MTTFIGKKIGRALTAALIATIYAGCSMSPHTGETVTKTTDSSGLTITTADSREILPSGKLAGTESALHEITADVAMVDAKSRLLTLRTADNKKTTFKVGEAVRNLHQVKVGDRVSLSYLETVTFEVRAPTAQELKDANSPVGLVGRALQGEKPGGVVGVGASAILTITGIDKQNQLISFRGPNGTGTVKAKYPENLKYVKEGDTVVVTAAELLAADVAPVS